MNGKEWEDGSEVCLIVDEWEWEDESEKGEVKSF
jgi:hypothetical protein